MGTGRLRDIPMALEDSELEEVDEDSLSEDEGDVGFADAGAGAEPLTAPHTTSSESMSLQ